MEKLSWIPFMFLVFPVASASTQDVAFPTEADIIKEGHFGGIVPSSYNVSLEILTRFRAKLTRGPQFRGTVAMKFTVVVGGVRAVFVNSVRLAVTDAVVEELSTQQHIWPINKSRNGSTLRFDLPFGLLKGNSYLFRCNFSGRFQNNGGAYYRHHKSSAAITTLLEMRFARWLFPCVDHPIMKANFELCVYHKHDMYATILSNTEPIWKGLTPTGGQGVCFAKTPKLPTYLVAFAVLHNFQRVSSRPTSWFPVDVYYGKQHPNTHELARKMIGDAQRMVEHLENRFKHKFPLDSLSIILHETADGIAGMENFGLISLSDLWWNDRWENMDDTLAHEIAHTIIGNDMTVKNWDEICLQEGLTTLLEVDTSRAVLKTNASLVTKRNISMFSESSLPPLIHQYPEEGTYVPCYCKAPVVFSTIQQMLGKSVFNDYIGKLLDTFHMSNLGFADWLRYLGEKSEPAMMALDLYFTQRGIPTFKVDIKVQGELYTARIKEFFYSPEDGLTNKVFGVALPMDIRAPGYSKRYTTHEANIKVKVQNSKYKWMIIDTTKVYYAVIYNKEAYQYVEGCFKQKDTDSTLKSKDSLDCPTMDQRKAMFADLRWAKAVGAISEEWVDSMLLTTTIPAEREFNAERDAVIY